MTPLGESFASYRRNFTGRSDIFFDRRRLARPLTLFLDRSQRLVGFIRTCASNVMRRPSSIALFARETLTAEPQPTPSSANGRVLLRRLSMNDRHATKLGLPSAPSGILTGLPGPRYGISPRVRYVAPVGTPRSVVASGTGEAARFGS